jgi:hypothetical protein
MDCRDIVPIKAFHLQRFVATNFASLLSPYINSYW